MGLARYKDRSLFLKLYLPTLSSAHWKGFPDIRIDPYFWKTVVGQLSRPFWGGGGGGVKKKHPIFGFLASSHIPLIHFAKKMSQNGQLFPQQGQKHFTPGYMGSPLPTQMVLTEIQI